MRNALSPVAGGGCPISAKVVLYKGCMNDWLSIPKGRKRLPIFRLCLILALTALIYLVVAPRVFAVIVLNMSVF